jgi:hypothetical protein
MREIQTGRVGVDAAVVDRRRGGAGRAGSVRGGPPRRVRGAPRRARRARTGYPLPQVRFVTGLALIAALTMATVGIEAYVRAGHQQARITALQAQLAGLQRRVAADERGAAAERRHVRSVAAQAVSARRALSRVNWALQSVPSEAQIAGVRDELAAYASCIPQLQREIAGLGISWRVDPAKPASGYFRLGTVAPISASCRSALTGR